MAKATHSGHCQVCGCSQKLPNGVMSKHGYTVEYGWFNGVCPGAGQLPYEQSCEMVKRSIVMATEHKDRLAKEADELLAGKLAEGTKAWKNVYIGSRFCRYRWEEVTLIGERHEYEYDPRNLDERVADVPCVMQKRVYFTFSYVAFDGKTHKECVGTNADSVDARRLVMNADYARYLQGVVKSQEGYIATQQRRVNEWKLADLTPVG